MTTSFGRRLSDALAAKGHLCVGIDPHRNLLDAWGLEPTAEGVRTFGLTVIDALADVVAVCKPQSAFFEEYGAAGIAALEDVLAHARDAGLLTILDVKRGDIGSTMAGYARAYLGDGPLAADAITLSPYLGLGSLDPAFEMARGKDRGAFVLALTSNPQGPEVQHASTAHGSVAGDIIAGVDRRNREAGEKDHLGSFGLVIGATIGNALDTLDIDLGGITTPILAPGLGAQGADTQQVRRVFGPACRNVIASTSRAVLSAGPEVKSLRQSALHANDSLVDLFA